MVCDLGGLEDQVLFLFKRFEFGVEAFEQGEHPFFAVDDLLGDLLSGAKNPFKAVDNSTEGYASYFMINCAHPDHFADVLVDGPWMRRVRGIVANASRCSHAELDNAEVLDAGDPIEFGGQLANLRQRFPHITVLGGCCGTDIRHMQSIATRLGN